MTATLSSGEAAFILSSLLETLEYIENLGAENPDKNMTEEMFDAAHNTLKWANERINRELPSDQHLWVPVECDR